MESTLVEGGTAQAEKGCAVEIPDLGPGPVRRAVPQEDLRRTSARTPNRTSGSDPRCAMA